MEDRRAMDGRREEERERRNESERRERERTDEWERRERETTDEWERRERETTDEWERSAEWKERERKRREEWEERERKRRKEWEERERKRREEWERKRREEWVERQRGRILEEEARPKASRQRFTTSSKVHSSMDASPLSAQSTLRKSGRGLRTSLPGAVGEATAEYTTVVFSFCEEQFPYRTKIPGRQITLRQFKEYLPKKGSYRYFFKTECDDLDTKVIQEEITEDNEVLPLWEGKVMAQVKPIE